MAEKIRLVKGDTRPALVCNLTDEVTGQPIQVGGATPVLKFRKVGATTLTATVPGVVTNSEGQVTFFPQLAPEMLQGEPGDYEGEVEVTFADGTKQTVFDLLKFKVRGDF